jgi:hypothetical protein
MTVYAATYRDVPSSHFAYRAVEWVSNPSNGSFMVGDASNNFHPSRVLDKFEAAKILAMAAGYKYSASLISPAEQELFDRSYNEWKSLLDSMSAQFVRWNKTADREIAYLLHKNVLAVTDIGRFIIKIDNVETINVLTKQEAIVFLIRLEGKQASAEGILLPYHTPFRDDALIQADYKKIIYYAKEAGIAGGSDGYINPGRGFTRAEMAQMLYNIRANRPEAPEPSNVSFGVPPGAVGTTIIGTIEYVFLDSHVYLNTDGRPQMFKLAPNAVIMLDNIQRGPSFLSPGMGATALVNAAGDILSLVARPVRTEPVAETVPVSMFENEGYVTALSHITPPGEITIQTRRVRLSGDILTEERAYTLAAGCIIRRGRNTVDFSDIKINDIIMFRHNGPEIFEISLSERERSVTGTLVEKKFINNMPFLVIEDDNKIKHELRITGETFINRGNDINISFNDLRLGDKIEAECEYDRLVYINANGIFASVYGVLNEIKLSQAGQQISVMNTDGILATYTVIPGAADIYELRIGMSLLLFLDSWEVYGIERR